MLSTNFCSKVYLSLYSSKTNEIRGKVWIFYAKIKILTKLTVKDNQFLMHLKLQ